MRWLTLIVGLLLAGCGESYHLPTATLRVDLDSVSDLEQTQKVLHAELVHEGFSASVAPRGPVEPSSKAERARAQSWATRVTYWQHRGNAYGQDRDIWIYVWPFPDGSHPYCAVGACRAKDGSFVEPSYPLLEIKIVEGRPGGFSEDGLAVYGKIRAFVDQLPGAMVVVEAPQVNEAEYDRISTNRLIVTVAWWLIAWPICVAVVAGIGMLFFRKARRTTRRIALVVLVTFFATPLPLNTGFFSFYVPGVMVLGDIPILLEQSGMLVPIAFGLSFVLSLVMAFLLVGERDKPELTAS